MGGARVDLIEIGGEYSTSVVVRGRIQNHYSRVHSLKQWIQELEFPQLQQDSPAEEAKTESNVWDDRSENETESAPIIWDIGDEEEEYPFVNKYLSFQEEPTMLVEEESCPVYDTDNEEEESMSVYDTNIEDVIEEEEGFVGKEGFGEEEDNIKDVVVVTNDLCSSMIQTILSVDFEEDVNTKAHELMLFGKSIIIKSEDKLTLSKSSAKTVRKHVLRILQKMITYGLCQRTTWVAKSLGVLEDDVLDGLNAPIYCRLLYASSLRELISSNRRLIPEEITPSIPRVATPRVIRHTTSDLCDKIGQLEIRVNINEGMMSRQSYHSDIYASVFEHIGAHQGTTLRDPYNPPNYAEEPQQ
ncbi:hypothetical protein Tco_1200327 [Tanacetum coccineum]